MRSEWLDYTHLPEWQMRGYVEWTCYHSWFCFYLIFFYSTYSQHSTYKQIGRLVGFEDDLVPTWWFVFASKLLIPYLYFIQIFTNDIFGHMVRETIQYAIYCEKNSFNINGFKMKKINAINIITRYIKYPSYRLYWSSHTSLRLPVIAERRVLTHSEQMIPPL